MKVLVCGSRHYSDYVFLSSILDELEITKIIHGAAKGADSLADRYAKEGNIEVQAFPADWNKFGKAAGPIRNLQMLKEAKPDRVVAFMFPNSRGTKHMVESAKKAGIVTDVLKLGYTPVLNRPPEPF